MYHSFVTAKLHRATVTDANLNYKGSIAICPKLLQAAGIHKFELVHVNNVRNGAHWETYVLEGQPGELTLHGPPAHWFTKGDLVVVNRIVQATPDEIGSLTHTVVYLSEANEITSVTVDQIS